MKDTIGKIAYYKTVFLGLDNWQISLYNKDNRIVDAVYCANKHIMLGYTSCLDYLGCKEL